MALAYLTAEAARTQLIELELYTEEDAPTLPKLTRLLLQLEDVIDGWVNYRVAPTEYTEVLTSTIYNTIVLTSHYPVIAVTAVERVHFDQMAFVPEIGRINLEGTRSLNFYCTETSLKVTYTAGYDPIPPEFSRAIFNLLLRVLENGSSIDFLYQPASAVEEIRLPGGLGKKFKISDASPELANSVLDNALTTLKKYRRTIITTSSTVLS